MLTGWTARRPAGNASGSPRAEHYQSSKVQRRGKVPWVVELLFRFLKIYQVQAQRIKGAVLNKQVLIAVLCAPLIVACGGTTTPTNEPTSDASSSQQTSSHQTNLEHSEAVEADSVPASGWTYTEDKDEMRGTTTKFAFLESENDVGVSWPYTPQPARLVLRDRPLDGLSIIVQIDGQFTCNSYDDDQLAVKFDEGTIESYSCAEPDGGGTGALFIRSQSKFLQKLKEAEKVVIELPVYEAGPQQVTFRPMGLVWE